MTGERAAEAALRESEERFRVTFEQAPIGVSLIDLDGRFLQVNDAYCRTVGRSREELLKLGPVGDHAPRRRRADAPRACACWSTARSRWCASRSATSTPAATRSGSR